MALMTATGDYDCDCCYKNESCNERTEKAQKKTEWAIFVVVLNDSVLSEGWWNYLFGIYERYYENDLSIKLCLKIKYK